MFLKLKELEAPQAPQAAKNVFYGGPGAGIGCNIAGGTILSCATEPRKVVNVSYD